MENNITYNYNIDFNYYENLDLKDIKVIAPRGRLQFDLLGNEKDIDINQLFYEITLFTKEALEAVFEKKIDFD